MKQITPAYEAILNSLEDDLEKASEAFEIGEWSVLIARAEALVAGATILQTWDNERERE